MDINKLPKCELIKLIKRLNRKIENSEFVNKHLEKRTDFSVKKSDIKNHNRIQDVLEKTSHDLNERIKELGCLYKISNILTEPNLLPEKAFPKILRVIIPSYQYPDITVARLIIDDKEYKTKGFRNTKWKQFSTIWLDKEKIGTLEILYLKKRPDIFEGPFLKEERHLLNSIAQLITQYIKRQRAEDALRQSELRFRTLIDKAPVAISLSRKGFYIYNNKMFLRMYGIKTIYELINKPIINQFAPQCRKDIKEKTRLRELKLPIPNEYESIGLHNKGNEFPVHIVITRIDLADGPASIAFHINAAERKKAEQALKESREQLKNFASHLQTIREEERVYISRELHDNLGQSLTALRIDLFRIIKKNTDENKVNSRENLIKQTWDMISLVDSIIQSVRTIARELRPSALDDLGLLAAIEWQISEFVKRSGIKCRLLTKLKKIEIDKTNSIGVFRIIQESLTNVLRHSKATEVKIKILEKENETIIEIKDNGCGIKESDINSPKSLGLLGMRERALLFGGKFILKGEKANGTKIILKIPKTIN